MYSLYKVAIYTTGLVVRLGFMVKVRVRRIMAVTLSVSDSHSIQNDEEG